MPGWEIEPLAPSFAARIHALQAASASEADVAAIKQAMIEYAVVVLPEQELDEEQQVAFGRRFGPLDSNPLAEKSYNAGMRPELLKVTNVDDDMGGLDPTDRRRLLDMGNKLWHTDSSFKAVTAHLSMLYGLEVAQDGGETQFADLRAGFEGLSEYWQELVDGLIAAHSPIHSRVMLGFNDWDPEHIAMHQDIAHDLVRTLPESGRKSLYLSAHASHIVGLPVPIGRMLLHELTELATSQDNVYTHKWRRHDLVIWDNRCTVHRLRRYRAASEQRVLRRVSTADTAFPARDPAGVTVPDWIINEAA